MRELRNSLKHLNPLQTSAPKIRARRALSVVLAPLWRERNMRNKLAYSMLHDPCPILDAHYPFCDCHMRQTKPAKRLGETVVNPSAQCNGNVPTIG